MLTPLPQPNPDPLHSRLTQLCVYLKKNIKSNYFDLYSLENVDVP